MTVRAVAFDFGGPVLLTPFELLEAAERRLGLVPGTFAWRGPFDPDADPLWQRMTAGQISERDYWGLRARQFAAVAGIGEDWRDLFGYLFDAPTEQLVRPIAERFAQLARQAGLVTAVLTNDLGRFHTAEWIAGVPFLRRVDTLVDGSVTGVLKPDPKAYRLLLDALGMAPHQVLFIDDQVRNVEAAEREGLVSVLFDPADAAGSYRKAAQLLGLDLAQLDLLV